MLSVFLVAVCFTFHSSTPLIPHNLFSVALSYDEIYINCHRHVKKSCDFEETEFLELINGPLSFISLGLVESRPNEKATGRVSYVAARVKAKLCCFFVREIFPKKFSVVPKLQFLFIQTAFDIISFYHTVSFIHLDGETFACARNDLFLSNECYYLFCCYCYCYCTCILCRIFVNQHSKKARFKRNNV